MDVYEMLGIIKGTKDQATTIITKDGIDWIVMEKDGDKYTWDHNGALWRKTTMFDYKPHLKEKPKEKPKVEPKKVSTGIQYYTGRSRRVGD